MPRLIPLVVFLFTLAAPLLAAPPNILVLLSDDQRPDTIHSLGNDLIRTPNLDQLAARGTAFTNAHIMGSLVGAVCQPSRCMILTGRTLFRAPPNPGPEIPLFPEEFRKAGYTTFATGKWHNGPGSFARCFAGADNVFFGGMNDQFKMPVQSFDPAGKYPRARQRIPNRHSSELFADTAVEFLKTRATQTHPFLLWVAFTLPHDPRQTPPSAQGLYDPEKIPLPKNFMSIHPFDNGEMTVRDEALLPTPRPAAMVKKDLADYYTAITHMDAQIGRILEALDQSGQRDNTLIVFAGDNGLAVGSHGLLGKQNLYQHSVGVPLLMAGPGIKPGQRSDALLYLLDLYPTLADLIQQPLPQGVEGKSFSPILKGNTTKHRDSLFFAYRNVQRAVRDQRFKLIRYTVKGKTTEQLFDLSSDPDELKDLSPDPAHAETLHRLRTLLDQERKSLGDPTLQP